MSDICGNGHGSKHNWQRGYTEGACKCTHYLCACGASFFHYYDQWPDIFGAMKVMGVPEECAAEKGSAGLQPTTGQAQNAGKS